MNAGWWKRLAGALGVGLMLMGCRQHDPLVAENSPDGLTATNDRAWKSAPFYVLQTALSPATLVHSSTTYLGLFAGMTNYGLAAPTYVAWATMNGPRTFRRGETLDVSKMEDGWVLVWWAGAEGWTNWDSPWVVFLQHKPDAMKLDEDGLHMEFPIAAGDVVLMPLYGHGNPPQQGHGLVGKPGSRASKIKTWEWPKVLTRDPLTRIRYWAAVTRELPIECEESMSADRANENITLRSRFSWYSIDDDWKTRHIKLAPLSPSLGRLAKADDAGVRFSRKWFDLDLLTPDGPYLAVEGVDAFDAMLPAFSPAPNADTRAQLITEVRHEVSDAPGGKAMPVWPQLVWSNWKTRTGMPWTFGHLKPVREGAPQKVEGVPLNRDSRVIICQRP